MNANDAFLLAIRETPHDDTPRLVYADWLEERGDPRSEFIRVQCELAQLPPEDASRVALEERERELWDLQRVAIIAEAARGSLADTLQYVTATEMRETLEEAVEPMGVVFRRGFVSEIHTFDEWPEGFNAVIQRQPITMIEVMSLTRNVMRHLFKPGNLSRLRELRVYLPSHGSEAPSPTDPDLTLMSAVGDQPRLEYLLLNYQQPNPFEASAFRRLPRTLRSLRLEHPLIPDEELLHMLERSQLTELASLEVMGSRSHADFAMRLVDRSLLPNLEQCSLSWGFAAPQLDFPRILHAARDAGVALEIHANGEILTGNA